MMTLTMVKGRLLLRRLRQNRLRASWYRAVCCVDAVIDMTLYTICGLYVYEDCVGHTKEDTNLLICPKCVQ